MKTKVISLDVTSNGECFEIETPSLAARFRSFFNVIPVHMIENVAYDLSEATVSSRALAKLIEMNSRHVV